MSTPNIPEATLVQPLTVVIPARNQADALRRHLPAVLSQDYDLYDVIVVDMASADETLVLLEAMEMEYDHLRHLQTPPSARDISLERLALTLGIRAAQSEWVVITQADCEPASSHWLTTVSKSIRAHADAEIVMGYSRYDRPSPSWTGFKMGFHRLWHQQANYSHILTGHAAVRGDGCNVAVRKSCFIRHDGFAAHQNLKTGAADLMVNHYSTPTNTQLCTDPRAVVVQDLPTRSQWWQQQVFYVETRRYQRNTLLYRTRFNLSLAWPWVSFLFIGLPVVAGILGLSLSIRRADVAYLHPLALLTRNASAPVVPLSAWDIVVFSLLLLTLLATLVFIATLRIRQFNQLARTVGTPTYRLTYILFELCMPFWAMRAWLRHRFTKRNTFRKEFV